MADDAADVGSQRFRQLVKQLRAFEGRRDVFPAFEQRFAFASAKCGVIDQSADVVRNRLRPQTKQPRLFQGRPAVCFLVDGRQSGKAAEAFDVVFNCRCRQKQKRRRFKQNVFETFIVCGKASVGKKFFYFFQPFAAAGRQQRGMFLFPVINASGFVRTDAETAVKLNGGEGGGLGRRFDYAGDFFGRFGRGSGRG